MLKVLSLLTRDLIGKVSQPGVMNMLLRALQRRVAAPRSRGSAKTTTKTNDVSQGMKQAFVLKVARK